MLPSYGTCHNYLFFLLPKSAVCHHRIPWMFAKFSTGRPYPLCRLAAGTNCGTLSSEYGWLVQPARLFSPSWWKRTSYCRLGRHRVVWTRDTCYAIYVNSHLQMQNVPCIHVHTIFCSPLVLYAAHRRKRWRTYVDTEAILSSQFGVPRG